MSNFNYNSDRNVVITPEGGEIPATTIETQEDYFDWQASDSLYAIDSEGEIFIKIINLDGNLIDCTLAEANAILDKKRELEEESVLLAEY